MNIDEATPLLGIHTQRLDDGGMLITFGQGFCSRIIPAFRNKDFAKAFTEEIAKVYQDKLCSELERVANDIT